ncbi:TonB-dependent siderophore receptor [Xanthobacter tagetidis]|jgi:iron complex outermembrane receptor protein|uniref:TonB-dependent siderophore receptor n=1 Tax=Xanthobacter tagetidis TaxID=60216 RepID=A0A3L7AE18_9HYPH|nr:TonB-dependent siderophore receptor [Xanthobacter tagetidis]MBB6306085.1 iron complex outermembrane receptor protein [Xanthobacter tagetidis]RLP77642.1 TonB-dependent siderophore receptor [Xanthobacter tagetidis]
MTAISRTRSRTILLCGVALGALAAAPGLAQQSDTQLEELTVEGRNTQSPTGPVQGYVARNTITGSKTDTPIIEIPQSVSVVTRDQMDDRQVQNVGQALDYSVGVLGQPFGTDPRFDAPLLRGFSAANSQYLNSLKLVRELGATSIEPYGLERIDVLLGPASVLYGQGNPGGLIDMISKRPTFTTFGEVQGQIGSFDRYVGAFDVGGVVGTDFAYRLTGLARDSGTETDYLQDNRLFFAPALTWKGADTSLTILANVQYDEVGSPVGLPVEYTVGPRQNLLSPNLFLGDPNYNSSNRTLASIGYEFQHSFNDAWQVRQNGRYLSLNWDYTNLYYSALDATNPTIANRGSSANSENQDTFTLDTQIQGNFQTGALSHKLLLGVDFRHYSQDNLTEFGVAPPISLLMPTYGPINPGTPWYTSAVNGTVTQTGLYAQDQIRYGKWLLTAGIRQDWASVDSTTDTNFGDTVQDQNDAATTGRIGLTYLFDNGLAPYASYSTSFEPVIGNMPAVLGGAAFKPSTGEQVEVGVKYQPVGWNAFFTAALYDIRQQNVLSNELIGGINYQTQIGAVEVKGLELSATMSLSDGWRVLANYTYMNAEITEGEFAGNRPANVPENMGNVWLQYSFKSGTLAGLGVAGGVRYVGSRYALDNNSIFLDANTLFDAALTYEKGPYKAQINVNNIANETYVSSCGFFGCYYGNGRTVIGQLSYRW